MTSLARWTSRGAAAALIFVGVAVLDADPAATRFIAPATRIVATPGQPLPLEGAALPVASLLAVSGPMRYGEFVWDDSGVAGGPLWVRIDREAQLISVFRGGDEIGTAVILYGAPDKPTPAGRYPILAKRRDHRSSLYDAEMPFTLRLTGDGVSIHASDVREGRATHGCIGLPEPFARKLFDQAKVGDPVVIV
ncbi:L,D-transpeptidase family protein [Sphingomonas sp. CGMCC 1.13658]|uniref:L,D-transpeptidase family protein n=1 Tax=Sphingomonas sp. CGMCC 1.13658 TaxID=2755554 RepID=UPI00286817AF|nr:L,D-transpeptidase family protein [Sphingomonas sp. CGMCC 1.13658]